MKKPIRLYWGENYSPKSPKVIKSIEKAFGKTFVSIHLYPGSLYQKALGILSKSFQIKPDQIILGHGIEGLVHLTSLTFLDKGKSGGMFQPSFYVYADNLDQFTRISYPVHYAKKININHFLKYIEETQLFYLASPNTATGNYLVNKEEIEYILRQYKGVFVVDECYYGMGNQTILPWINKYDNLLIYRGFSKVTGMASLRLGIACGNKSLIEKLRFNQTDLEADTINTFSLHVVLETLPYFQELALNTKKFISEFLNFLQPLFPQAAFLDSLVTYQFMNIKKYDTPAYKIINYMNKNGYLLSDSNFTNDSSLPFPELIKFPAPPKEHWKDFAKILKEALNQ